LLKEQGITCSMSRAGEVWDNSAMESFFSSLIEDQAHGQKGVSVQGAVSAEPAAAHTNVLGEERGGM